MKKTKKLPAEGGILISGLGNARIASRGSTITVDGVDADSHIEQVSVSVSSPNPKVTLQNVSSSSVIIVNGKRVN